MILFERTGACIVNLILSVSSVYQLRRGAFAIKKKMDVVKTMLSINKTKGKCL